MSLSADDHDVRVSKPWSLSEGAAAVLLMVLAPSILVLDYTSGRDISLHLFYLLPTGLAAWSFGARAGFAVGLVAACYWAFVGFATRHPGAPVLALVWDVASTLALFLFFAFVVGRHRRFVDRLLDTARLDVASGALSKREFARLLETEVRRARRYRRPLALALFDVDAGAVAKLPAIVRAVASQVRDSDAIGRADDRRLGILLVECPAGEAFRVAARIRGHLAGALHLEPAGPAIGLASYGGAGTVTAADLMQIASSRTAIAQDANGLSEQRVD